MKKLTSKQASRLLVLVIMIIITLAVIQLSKWVIKTNPNDVEFMQLLGIIKMIAVPYCFIQLIFTVRSFLYPNE